MTTATTDIPADWPMAEHSRIVASSPHRWHVQQMGTGTDIVLLHGAGASSHSWRSLAPMLAKDHRVTTLDLPGHGFTKMGARGRSSLRAIAQDISALLTTLDVAPRLIVGHSAGAAIALQLARIMPQTPDRLVVINGALENFKGAAGWLFPVMAKALVLNPLAGFLLSRGGASIGSMRNLIKSTGTDLPPDGLALYQRLISQRKHVEGTLAMMAQWSLEDLTAALPQIAVPTLFVHGDKDSAVQTDVARRAADAMPYARLVILPGVGHIAHEEVPKRVFDEIKSFMADRPE